LNIAARHGHRDHLGRGAGDPFRHRAIGVRKNAAVAEEPPGERDRRGPGQRRDARRKRPVARMDVPDLVDVERQDPVRRARSAGRPPG
jgi:hypothetical protein